MAFKTYDEARAALLDLNARIYALKAPKMDAGTEAHEAFNATRRALRAEGEAAGFERIFDNSFKLSPTQVALPR